MKTILLAMAVVLTAVAALAQDAKVTVAVSVTASNQIAEMNAHGIPMDYVINAGYAQSVARIKGQISLQIDTMTLEQLLAAYPKFAPLVDTNDRPEVAATYVRQYAKNDVQRIKTISAATATYENQQAAVTAHPNNVDVPDRFKLHVDANGVGRIGDVIVSTNAGPVK